MFPRQPIVYTSQSVTAQDQGYVYERLTNRDAADGSTSPPPTNTGHDHSEPGNRMYRPLLAQAFGAQDGMNDTIWANAAVEQRPYTIWPNPSTTAVYSIRMLSMIFYVPTAFVDHRLVFAMDCEGRPRGLASVYDDTLSSVTFNNALQPLWQTVGMFAQSGAQSHYGFTFEVSAAGVYVIDIYTNLPVSESGGDEFKILGCMVVPEIDTALAGGYPRETQDAAASNLIQVGDTDNSNAWLPLDSNWTTEMGPLDAAPMLIANNNAFLYEKATGVPVPGNATLTASGHNHSGSGGLGAEIEHAIAAWCFGGAFPTTTTEVWGNNSRAPIPDNNNVSREVFRTRIYMPDSNGVANLKCWVLVGGETSKCGTMEVVVHVGGSSQTFTSTGSGSTDPAWLDIIGGTAFGSYSGGSVNVVRVLVRLTVDTAPAVSESGKPRVYGVCLALVP